MSEHTRIGGRGPKHQKYFGAYSSSRLWKQFTETLPFLDLHNLSGADIGFDVIESDILTIDLSTPTVDTQTHYGILLTNTTLGKEIPFLPRYEKVSFQERKI